MVNAGINPQIGWFPQITRHILSNILKTTLDNYPNPQFDRYDMIRETQDNNLLFIIPLQSGPRHQ